MRNKFNTERCCRILANKLANYPKYSQYSDHVKRIVEFEGNGKNIRVIAGAGSGKTETLTMRIINLLLLKKATPEEIVAFTFTEKAAQSLKTRIYQRIQQMGEIDILNSLGKMYIGTIHAYCLQLLKDHYNFGNWDMLDEVSQIVYVRKYAEDLRFFFKSESFLRDYKVNIRSQDRPKKFLQSYEILYDEELNKQAVAQVRPKFIEKVDILESYFNKDRVLTFGQLIKEAIAKLETDRTPVKDLKYLFVDEYQDVNKAQVHLVQLLGEDIPSMNKQTEIFVVGDPKQSIYHWRGSSLKSFLEFNTMYPNKDVETFYIPENWRSLNNIVKLSNRFSDLFYINNPSLQSTPMRTSNNGVIGVLSFSSYEEEAKWIVEQIQHLVSTGNIQYRDIAVLYRSVKKSAGYLINACKEAGIPYVLGGKVGLFRRIEIQALVKFFAWLHEKGFWGVDEKKIEGDALVEIGAHEWLAACQEAGFNTNFTEQQIIDILKEWKQYWINEFTRVYPKIEDQKKELENPASPPVIEQTLVDGTDIMDKSDTDLSGQNVTSVPATATRIMNFADYLEGPTFVKMLNDLLGRLNIKAMDYQNSLHSTMLANIGRFSEILTTFEFTNKRGGSPFYLDSKIKDLCYFLEGNQDLFEESQGEDLRYIDAIQIFTVHQAKGLEWPIVFIPWLIRNTFPTVGKRDTNYISPVEGEQPLYDIERYKSKIEDEARLFYVAMTRAKNVLMLSRAIPDEASNRSNKPSQFLETMLKDLEATQYLLNLEPSTDIRSVLPPLTEFTRDSGEEFEEYSISDILHYKQCPIHYLFNNVWGFSPILRRLLGFGHSLHHCLRVLVKKTEQGLDLTDSAAMKRELEQTINYNFILPYLGDGVNKIMQNAARKILERYISTFGKELNNMNSVEARLEFLENRSILKGIADVIMDSGNSNDPTVRVRDYKTTMPDVNASDAEQLRMQTYEMQLQLYSIALEKMGLKVSEADLGFLKESRNVRVDLSESAKQATLQETENIIRNIKNQTYPSNCGNNCQRSCDFKYICKYHGANPPSP